MFGIGERVIFRSKDGGKERGKITKILPRSRKIVTDSGHRLQVSVRRLKPSPDRVLILEGRLDRNLRSDRTYGPMLKQWLSTYGAEALYEKVHSIADLQRFLRREGKDVATRFIHITCHGEDLRRHRTAKLSLTFEKVDLIEDRKIFEGLDGKVLIFSCCEVGKNAKAMETIKKVSGAAAVISYRMSVRDSYTNLAEVLLYDRLLDSKVSPIKAVEQVQSILKELNPQIGDDNYRFAKKPVLVCF